MNLLSLFQDQIGGTLIDQASSFLGEDKSKTTSAMSAILPSLVGSMISKGSSSSGASDLLGMLTSGGHDGSMLDNVAGLFGTGDSTNGLMSSGGSILTSLLGDNLGKIVGSISNFSGMNEGSSSSLMKMAAPLIMSMVGKQVASKGLNVSGLMSLLSSQKEHVSAAMPSGLSGLSGLLGFADGFKDNITNAGAKVVETVGAGANAAADGAKAVANTGTKAGSSILKWLIPIALILLAASYFGFKTGCAAVDNTTDAVKETTSDVANAAGDAAKGAVDVAGDAANAVVDAAGDAASAVTNALKSVTLPGGKEISFAVGSFGDQIVNFLNGDEQDLSKGFTFDGLNFAVGSADLAEGSQKQIDNLAAILSVYQDYNVRIEGHTDNTGDAGKNKTLSANRAKSVKAALAAKGVTATRMKAAGFGQEKPIKDNSTEEGKAANRRVDLYFTK